MSQRAPISLSSGKLLNFLSSTNYANQTSTTLQSTKYHSRNASSGFNMKMSSFSTKVVPSLNLQQLVPKTNPPNRHFSKNYIPNSISVQDRLDLRKASQTSKRIIRVDTPLYERAANQFDDNNLSRAPPSTKTLKKVDLDDSSRKSAKKLFLKAKSPPVSRSKLLQMISRNPYYFISKKAKFGFYRGEIPKQKKKRKICKTLQYKLEDENILDIQTKLLSIRTNAISYTFKKVIRFKAIYSLWLKNSMVIEKLLFYYPDYKFFLANNEKMTRKKFDEFLAVVKLSNPKSTFSQRVFMIFDVDNSGTINTRDFFFVMKLTRPKEEVENVLDFLAEEITDSEGNAHIKVLYEILKVILSVTNYQKEKRKLVEFLNTKLGDSKQKTLSSIVVTREKFLTECAQSKFIIFLLKRYMKEYEDCDKEYEDELMNVFMINTRNSRNNLAGRDVSELYTHDALKLDKALRTMSICQAKKEELRKLIDDDS